jgi:hypothetical protein
VAPEAGLLGRILSQSIWAPDAIPEEEWKYRHLKRVFLPLFDVIAIYVGMRAILSGIPAITLLFGVQMDQFIAGTFTAAAFGALIGVAFPRLWVLEMIAKTGLVTAIGVYGLALFLLSTADEARAVVSGITTLAAILPGWRLTMLASEWGVRRRQIAKEKAAVQRLLAKANP